MSRPSQHSSSLMHRMTKLEGASNATYATHVTGLTLHEPSTISTVPLSSTEALRVGSSVHDTLSINHSIPLTSSAVSSVGLSVHDTMPPNHSVPLTSSAVSSVGLSVHDTMPLNHSVPLTSSAVSSVGSSVHDTMPINHAIPLASSVLSVHDNMPLHHPIPLSLPDGLPVGSHDTLTIDHSIQLSLPGALVFGSYDTIQHSIDHAREIALTGLDVDVSDPKHLLTGNQAVLLETDMIKAALEWMAHIDNPHHTPINILLNITDDDKNHARFDGGPAFDMSTGTGDNATWESAVEYKLQNGADSTTGLDGFPKLSDGAQADVVININSHYLNSVGWLDPNPPAGSPNDLPWSDPERVPYGQVDMVSELAHEFGHGLGIGDTKTLDTETGRFGAGEKTTWESLLDIERSYHTATHAYFTGSHAEREHGGPVVVTTNTPEENYQHLGNTLSDAVDPKTGLPDVMFGAYFDQGVRYEISDLDVAILQDLGYHTKDPLADMHISEVAHPTPLDIHSLVSGLLKTTAIHPADHATVLADAHVAQLQLDIAHFSDVAHQLFG